MNHPRRFAPTHTGDRIARNRRSLSTGTTDHFPSERLIRFAGIRNNQGILAACVQEANKGKDAVLNRLIKRQKRLENRIRGLTGQIQRVMEFLKSEDVVSEELREEHRSLVSEREVVRLDLDKTQIELNIRQREHLDFEVIQGCLSMFDQVVDSLPLEDQKELMQLLIKEIKASLLDPKKRKTPSEEGTFISKLRTKLVQVNISLHEIPSLPITYDDGERKFVIESDWLPEQDSNLRPAG